MRKEFDFVQNHIKRNIEYRVKEYSPNHKPSYEVGDYALGFNSIRKA